MLLSASMYCSVNPVTCEVTNCHSLSTYAQKFMAKMYSSVYNMHSIVHIVDNVARIGPSDTISWCQTKSYISLCNIDHIMYLNNYYHLLKILTTVCGIILIIWLFPVTFLLPKAGILFTGCCLQIYIRLLVSLRSLVLLSWDFICCCTLIFLWHVVMLLLFVECC